MAEKRLIDANALYDKVEQKYKVSSGIVHSGYREFLDMICDAPTVDAVEGVRCKDCAYGKENLICVNPHCTKSFYGCPVPSDHYCSFGERGTDEKV